MTRLEVGTKVVPLRKTAVGYGDLGLSNVWARATEAGQKFLYVNGYCNDHVGNEVYILGELKNGSGDYFRLDDVVIYEEEGADVNILSKGNTYVGKMECVEAGCYNFTEGQVYEVYTDVEDDEFYTVRDNEGEMVTCYKHRFEEIEIEEKKEEEEVKMSEVFYVNVVGANHYRGWKVFELGTKVYLHDEPNNTFDNEAVRVEDECGRKIGYVSASVNTRVKGCKSAGNIFEKVQKCGEMVGTVKFIGENMVIVEVVA